MNRDFFDPTPEQQNLILINATTLREAERLIESCENCNPEGAEIPFDAVRDLHRTLRQPHLFGSGVSVTHASSARIFSMEEWVRGIVHSAPEVGTVLVSPHSL